MVKDVCSVLLVDDEPLPRKLLAERIAKIPGMEVAASLSDGLSAKNYLLEHPVDVVMTDIRMPGMDGLELAEFIHSNAMGCGIIIFSGFEEFEYARQAMKYDVMDYLLKPLQFTQVVEALEKAHVAVCRSRERIRFPLPAPYRDLSQAINRSFQTGEDTDLWEDELGSLFQYPGKLLRITLDSHAGSVPENFFSVCRAILRELYSGSIVLTVSQSPISELFLILPQFDRAMRSIQSLRGWFAHILETKVTITPEGEVADAHQLAVMASTPKKPDPDQVIAIACDYIRTHLSEPLSREEVATKVYLSPSYFGHLFKKTMGVGYNEYLTDLRIRQAKAILANNISIREVAASVGFRDVKYFSEVFCKRTGLMPSEYRRGLLTGTVKQDKPI